MTGRPGILILELGGIGDVVMSLPAIEAVLTGCGDRPATILTVPRTKPIVESLRRKGFSNFEAVTTDALEGGGPDGWLRLCRALRKRRFDIVIDLSAVETNKAAVKRYLFLKMLGAKKTVGRDTDGRGHAFMEKAADTLTSSEHEVERKIKVASLLGLRYGQAVPKLVTGRDEKEKAYSFLSRRANGGGLLAGMNPGAYRQSRMWPEESFAEILEWLVHDMSAYVVLTGGRGEKGIVESLARSISHDKVMTIVDIPLMEFAALIERLDLFITNDTGPMHIAAALDVPTVALFGQTNLRRYHPCMDDSRYVAIKKDHTLCRRLSFRHPMQECRRFTCEGKECMTSIAVAEVKEAIMKLLSGRKPGTDS